MTKRSPLGLAPANILVVGDTAETRSLIRKALVVAGHHVADARNLAGGRAALKQCPTELVLCGLQLGKGESGLDFLSELAARSPDVAVVMLTGGTDIHAAIHCLRAGAFDYLLKGFQAGELKQVVARTLQRRRRMVSERERVAEQNGILSRFASENPNPVIGVSYNGLIRYVNAACQSIFG